MSAAALERSFLKTLVTIIVRVLRFVERGASYRAVSSM
jgi:hypothetical protein